MRKPVRLPAGFPFTGTAAPNKLVVHSTDNVLTTGTWSHIAVTYDASQAQASRFTIYVNGVDVTNRSDVVSAGTLAAIDPTNIRIGSDAPFAEFPMARSMKYVTTTACSPPEIQSDMNTSVGVDNVGPTVTVTAPAVGNGFRNRYTPPRRLPTISE